MILDQNFEFGQKMTKISCAEFWSKTHFGKLLNSCDFGQKRKTSKSF